MYQPTSLTLFITSVCPYHCRYCCYGYHQKKFMPAEYAIRRIREAKALGISSIGISGGEPALHPDFLRIFREAKKQGLPVTIGTSGFPMKKSLLRELLSYEQTGFYLPLDCADEQIHNHFRNPGAWSRSVQFINEARKIRPSVFISIAAVLVNETLERLPKTAEFVFSTLKADIFCVTPVFPYGRAVHIAESKLIKDKKKYMRIVSQISKLYGQKFSFSTSFSDCPYNRPNDFITIVYPDQNLYLCCAMPDKPLRIGTSQQKLTEILADENINRVLCEIRSWRTAREIRTGKKEEYFGCSECIEEYRRKYPVSVR